MLMRGNNDKSKTNYQRSLPALILAMGLTARPQTVVADDNFCKAKLSVGRHRSTPVVAMMISDDLYWRSKHILVILWRHCRQPRVPAAWSPTNYMYEPQDGTEIDSVEILRSPRGGWRRYDSLKFNYLGSAASVAVFLSGRDVPVENLADLRNFDGTFKFSASGRSGGTYVSMLVFRAGGYDVDVVTGFEGSSDQVLAVLRERMCLGCREHIPV